MIGLAFKHADNAGAADPTFAGAVDVITVVAKNIEDRLADRHLEALTRARDHDLERVVHVHHSQNGSAKAGSDASQMR